jgi:hypothetical protein
MGRRSLKFTVIRRFKNIVLCASPRHQTQRIYPKPYAEQDSQFKQGIDF